jgi:uncharacterized protein
MRSRCKKRSLGRPCLRKKIGFTPKVFFYKPRGIPMAKISIIELTTEELEALRLRNVVGLEQIEAAKKMKTSQSTFQRILSSAYKKVSLALVNGQAIKIKE